MNRDKGCFGLVDLLMGDSRDVALAAQWVYNSCDYDDHNQ